GVGERQDALPARAGGGPDGTRAKTPRNAETRATRPASRPSAQRRLAAVLLLPLFPGGVLRAEALPAEKYLPLALATEAATAAVEACQKRGYRVSATVVDRADVVRALLRADGPG